MRQKKNNWIEIVIEIEMNWHAWLIQQATASTKIRHRHVADSQSYLFNIAHVLMVAAGGGDNSEGLRPTRRPLEECSAYVRARAIKREEGSACARRETQSHEKLTFYEILKKSKNRFLRFSWFFRFLSFFFCDFFDIFLFLKFWVFWVFCCFMCLNYFLSIFGFQENFEKNRKFRFRSRFLALKTLTSHGVWASEALGTF